MQLVFIRCTLHNFEMKDFFIKLKAFVGDFRIEGQEVQEIHNNTVKISFYTDKVQIEEGKSREVELMAKTDADGEWNFIEIVK